MTTTVTTTTTASYSTRSRRRRERGGKRGGEGEGEEGGSIRGGGKPVMRMKRDNRELLFDTINEVGYIIDWTTMTVRQLYVK